MNGLLFPSSPILPLGALLIVGVTATPAAAQQAPSDPGSAPIQYDSAPQPNEEADSEWNNPVLAGFGIGLAAAGAAATIGGVYFLYVNDNQSCDESAPSCGMLSDSNNMIGASLVAGGAGLVLAGLPMIVVGSWQVESNRGDQEGIDSAQLEASPSSVRLHVTF